jgi:hypothetical protein
MQLPHVWNCGTALQLRALFSSSAQLQQQTGSGVEQGADRRLQKLKLLSYTPGCRFHRSMPQKHDQAANARMSLRGSAAAAGIRSRFRQRSPVLDVNTKIKSTLVSAHLTGRL